MNDTSKAGGRASVIALAAFVLAMFAQPALAGADAPRLYDGERFTVKPKTISDFEMSSRTRPRVPLIIGGPDATRKDPGEIVWKSWTRNKAIGIGTGWTAGCTCGMTAPWNGGKIRVTAYRSDKDKLARKQNRFSRVKVYQPDSWRKPGDSDDYYRMAMVYTGFNRPGSGWFVFGVHYPADLEPTGRR